MGGMKEGEEWEDSKWRKRRVKIEERFYKKEKKGKSRSVEREWVVGWKGRSVEG